MQWRQRRWRIVSGRSSFKSNAGNFFNSTPATSSPACFHNLDTRAAAGSSGSAAGTRRWRPHDEGTALVPPEQWVEERRVVVHAHVDREQHALHDGIDVLDVLLVEVQQAEGAPGCGAQPAGGSGRGGAALHGLSTSLASTTTPATPPSKHARNAARASGRSEQKRELCLASLMTSP